MNLLIILLIFILGLFVLSILTLGGDILQPICIISLSYMASIVCAMIMQPKWQYEYHYVTITLIAIGLFVMYCANLIAYTLSERRKIKLLNGTVTSFIKEPNGACNNLLKATKVNKIIYSLVIFLQLLAALIYFYDVLRITGGGSSFSEIMSALRAATGYGTESISFIATQMLNVSAALAYVCIYIFIKNVLVEGRKGNIKYLFPVVLYICTLFITAGRFDILTLIVATITIFGVLYRKRYGHGFTLQIYLYLILLILVALIGFYLVRTVFGRLDASSQNASIIEYIGMYLGGSIPLFDMYIQDPVEQSAIFGKEMFTALNNTLIEWGLIDADPYIIHSEFRVWNGISLGNVYTGFRRSLHDFGLFGMLFTQFAFVLIMAFFWIYANKKCSGLLIIIYARLAYTLYLHCINDYFYNTVFSLGMVARTVLLIIAYLVLEKNMLCIIFERIRVKLKNKHVACKK